MSFIAKFIIAHLLFLYLINLTVNFVFIYFVLIPFKFHVFNLILFSMFYKEYSDLLDTSLLKIVNTLVLLTKDKLMLIHINIKSLQKNKKTIEFLFNEMAILPSIIAVFETKINSNSNLMIDIENYNFVHADSLSKAGGVDIWKRFKFYCLIRYCY